MGDYQRPEDLVLTEKLDYLELHKRMLLRKLDKEEFQYRCNLQKQDEYSVEIKLRIIPVVIYTAVEIVLLVLMIWSLITLVGGNGGAVGIVFLLAWPGSFYFGYHCFIQWKALIQRICYVINSNNQEESGRIEKWRLKEEIEKTDKEIQRIQERLKEISI